MSSRSTARDANIGYFYQTRYALFLLMNPKSTSDEISIENFDDISFDENGTPLELIQTKHHSNPKSLSDKSEDLWKTIGNWVDGIEENTIKLEKTMLTLVTTSQASVDSAAMMLKAKDSHQRDVLSALKKLKKAGEESTNYVVITNYNKFNSLDILDQKKLLEQVIIIDEAPDIDDVEKNIKDFLGITTPSEHIDEIFLRIEGWWIGQVIKCLRRNLISISKKELVNRIISWRDGLRLSDLPIYSQNISEVDLKEEDKKMYIRQIEEIKLQNSIRDAKLNYLKAKTHRKKWMRQNSANIEDIQKFDELLKNQWSEKFNYYKNFFQNESNPEKLISFGQKIYSWANFDSQDLKLKNQAGLHFYTKGCFHKLADVLDIGWHPRFKEKLSKKVEVSK